MNSWFCSYFGRKPRRDIHSLGGGMKFGVFFFDGMESIDVAIFGVLSMARRLAPEIEMLSLAPKAGVVHMANGLKLIADYGLDDCPQVDAIVIVGGATWVEQIKNEATLAFFRERASHTIIGAVCTGAMILAATGLLDGKQATTRCEGVVGEVSPLVRMKNLFPAIDVVHSGLVDQGMVLTGGGVCLCIDMTLHLIKRLMGEKLANDLAVMLEYKRAWEANTQALPPIGV
jgi:transcriptional regulator GlxA family with amidase domain